MEGRQDEIVCVAVMAQAIVASGSGNTLAAKQHSFRTLSNKSLAGMSRPNRRAARLSAHLVPRLCRDGFGACGCNSPRQSHQGTLVPTICRNDPATGYSWKDVHDDLEAGVYAGCYGWDHAAYWGIAEAKAGVDLKEWYKTRTEAEFYLPEFKELIDDPATHRDWDRISTFDPLGMTAHPPTIAQAGYSRTRGPAYGRENRPALERDCHIKVCHQLRLEHSPHGRKGGPQ